MKTMLPFSVPLIAAMLGAVMLLAAGAPARAAESRTVTQYGITWTFDRPATVGQFVTGDYWVLGPVNIVSVSPTPGPAPEADKTKIIKNQFGDASFQNDNRMRNGSMIITGPNPDQGYDSRIINYKASLSVHFPLALKANESLISSISNENIDVKSFVAAIMWKEEKTGEFALKDAAILTCLDKAPPADAFRPAYAGVGKAKPIYETRDIRWDTLLKLKAPRNTPSWALYERFLQRPWLDHVSSWLTQRNGPSDNQPNYGREIARIGGAAALMVSLDVPKERKQKLVIELIQLGIDTSGLAKVGQEWPAEGGHWNGRKLPILFAYMMLGDKSLLPPASTQFSEDEQTYYGKGFYGDTVLYEMGFHHEIAPNYEERDPATWTMMDRRSESYRICCTSNAFVGTALFMELMGRKKLWDHDAFFDFEDRWMAKTRPEADKRPRRSSEEGHTQDPFVDAMWAAYRGSVPQQQGAAENRKWVYQKNGEGRWEPNPKIPSIYAIPGK